MNFKYYFCLVFLPVLMIGSSKFLFHHLCLYLFKTFLTRVFSFSDCSSNLNEEELIALNRDQLARVDPNTLFYGKIKHQSVHF
jgi:hypothetical protein